MSVDGFEYVRARFLSTEDILEQCSLCCVFVLCCRECLVDGQAGRCRWSKPSSRFVWPLGERQKIEMEGHSPVSPVTQSNLSGHELHWKPCWALDATARILSYLIDSRWLYGLRKEERLDVHENKNKITEK